MPRSSPRRGRARIAEDRTLVLRRFRYGESSLVVHLLTPRYGRVAALAKGAYRPKSATFGLLDLFDTLQLSWTGGSGSGLAVVRGGDLTVRRRRISSDLERYRAGLAILELARLGAREGHEEADLFALASRSLDLLQDTEAPPALVSVSFDLAFLELAGLAPALSSCASCGHDLSDQEGRGGDRQVPFSAAQGGRLCDSCAAAAGPGAGVGTRPLRTLRVARSLSSSPHTLLPRTHLDPALTREVRSLVRGFLEAHLETRLRAWGPPRRSPGPRPSPAGTGPPIPVT